jgi:hypothetical protein
MGGLPEQLLADALLVSEDERTSIILYWHRSHGNCHRALTLVMTLPSVCILLPPSPVPRHPPPIRWAITTFHDDLMRETYASSGRNVAMSTFRQRAAHGVVSKDNVTASSRVTVHAG